jgi:hypothetical protein
VEPSGEWSRQQIFEFLRDLLEENVSGLGLKHSFATRRRLARALLDVSVLAAFDAHIDLPAFVGLAAERFLGRCGGGMEEMEGLYGGRGQA